MSSKFNLKHFRNLLPYLGLWFLVVGVFWPCRNFSFLNWDDPMILTLHPWYSPLNARHLLEMWNPFSLLEGKAVAFSPLRDMSYALDYWLWGGLSSKGFHLSNVFLHATNALLAFWVATRFLPKTLAWLTALLWACHPMVVEPVAWVSSRKDLLMTTFALAGLAFLCQKKHLHYLAFGVASIFSKYVGLVLGIWGLLPSFSKGHKKIRWVGLALLVLGGGIVGFAIWANLKNNLVITANEASDWWKNWPAAFQVFPHYLSKALWPVSLSARYVQQPSLGWGSFDVWFGICIVVGWGTALWKANLPKGARIGLLILGTALFPYLPIVPTNIWMADRYFYLPLFGLIVVLVSFLNLWGEKYKFAIIFFGVCLGMLSVTATVHRLPVWKSSLALWGDTAERSPELYYVWSNLAEAQKESGDYRGAEHSFRQAISLAPHWIKGSLLLGSLYAFSGKPDRAATLVKKFETKASKQELQASLSARGKVWAQLKAFEKAEPLLKQALERGQDVPLTMVNLGTLYMHTERPEEALNIWRRAGQLRPGLPGAHLNLARYFFLEKNCPSMNRELNSMREASLKEQRDAVWLRKHCTFSKAD